MNSPEDTSREVALPSSGEGEVDVGDMTPAEAQVATAKIRDHLTSSWVLLVEVHERRGYRALGYDTFADYLSAEFNVSRSRGYQLLDQGRVTRELAEAAGVVSTSVDITEADARRLKPVLSLVTEEVADRVADGEDPDEVVADVVETAKIRVRVVGENADGTQKRYRLQTAEEAQAKGRSHAEATANARRIGELARQRWIEARLDAAHDELPRLAKPGASDPAEWTLEQWERFNRKVIAAYETIVVAEHLRARGLYTPSRAAQMARTFGQKEGTDWDAELAKLMGELGEDE